jgi:hypothetical protein
MNKLTRLIVLFLLPALWSCTEKVDWDLQFEEFDVLVVEGKITNEARAHEVKLSWPLYAQNGTPDPVSGAQVEIFDRKHLHRLREDPRRPGTYLTDPSFAGQVDSSYQLRIRYGDRYIRGVSRMREVLDFPDMRVYVAQQNPRLYGVHIGDQNGPAVIRMKLDWSHVPGYDTLPEGETHALIYHYTLSSVDVNRMFSPDQEQVYFPQGTIVYREKESVSLAYEEFLRGMLSETEWRGGVFDVQPGNARTNLSEGGIGFFTAAAVIRDTIIVQ